MDLTNFKTYLKEELLKDVPYRDIEKSLKNYFDFKLPEKTKDFLSGIKNTDLRNLVKLFLESGNFVGMEFLYTLFEQINQEVVCWDDSSSSVTVSEEGVNHFLDEMDECVEHTHQKLMIDKYPEFKENTGYQFWNNVFSEFSDQLEWDEFLNSLTVLVTGSGLAQKFFYNVRNKTLSLEPIQSDTIYVGESRKFGLQQFDDGNVFALSETFFGYLISKDSSELVKESLGDIQFVLTQDCYNYLEAFERSISKLNQTFDNKDGAILATGTLLKAKDVIEGFFPREFLDQEDVNIINTIGKERVRSIIDEMARIDKMKG